MSTEHTTPPESGFLQYHPLSPRRPIAVRQLYSVHYFEYTGTYTYPGEQHDFWELLYVDKGAVRVTAGERQFRLEQGRAVFHTPGEFHAFSAAGTAPDLVVIGFGCDSPAMDFFRERVTDIDAAERALLGRVVAESAAAFSTPLNLSTATELERREDPPFGAEQMVCAALEELLVRLIRRGGQSEPPSRKQPEDGGMLAQVMDYLEARVDRPLTLEQICRDNLVGRSQLQKLFHARTGGGVMACFGELKIQAARRLIREGRLNFTQIAAQLGYQSVHYFSRRFRAATGMSPSEYERSVKMLSEHSGLPPDDNANNVHDCTFPFQPDPLIIKTDSGEP